MPDDERCPAAHHDDPTPCVGDHDAVLIVDQDDTVTEGCEHHGARLLASLEGGRVLQGSVPGASVRVHRAADGIRPFPWLTNAPRTEPSQRSHAENRDRRDT
ncbi:hypothetical protein [Streptomyces nigrescens]|uniref:hypothetical protein n=1 Tax=Streptomyces nigrescens TaxID=1920 RepID=UPI0036F8A464